MARTSVLLRFAAAGGVALALGCSVLIDASDLVGGAPAAVSSEGGAGAVNAVGSGGAGSGSAGETAVGTGGTSDGGAGSSFAGSHFAGFAGFAGSFGGFGGVAGTQGESGAAGTSSAGVSGGGGGGVYWTGWLNRDTPEGLGDIEQRASSGSACEHPIDFEARVAGTNVAYFLTGERLVASTEFGIECLNENQSDAACEDYEIKFLCPKTWPVPGTWSDWKSRDTPAASSDNEQLSEWSSPPCVSPWAIEATTISGIDYATTGDFVRIEPDFGLLCQNSLQPDGACSDYRVRFFCPEFE
jgi:hypothetical protein